ncbi:MAG: hypothetical protein WBG71_11210 [Leeuwenhoekiella sp.]
MKILFICGSLEPGKDGVGDYTIKLSEKLTHFEYECSVIALSDPYVSELNHDLYQLGPNKKIATLRIPKNQYNSVHRGELQKLIDLFNPDVISLQFVPFAYNDKGIPLYLVSLLKSINTVAQWHVMFHEIWIGHASRSIFGKSYWIGSLQKRIIYKLQAVLNPVCHTHALYYKYLLNKEKITTYHLPLYGNIKKTQRNRNLFYNIIKESPLSNWQSQNILQNNIAVIFGSFPEFWDLSEILNKWSTYLTNENKTGLLFILGKHNYDSTNKINRLRQKYPLITFIRLGILQEKAVSQILLHADFGINPTPLAIVEKSGAAAAMLDHGLSIITTRVGIIQKNTEIDFLSIPNVYFEPNLRAEDFGRLIRKSIDPKIDDIAQIYINDLKTMITNALSRK